MKILNRLLQVYWRFQYPVSLPEEIAEALGINASNGIGFTEFIRQLSSPSCAPTKLKKFMSREEVEATFAKALRKERFARHSLFSYYFNKGWLGFYLQFDQDSKLRRVWVQHKALERDNVEINLQRPPQLSRTEGTPLDFGFPF